MTGTADATVSLDVNNNGTAQIVSTNLLLSDMSGPFNIPLLGFNLTLSFVDVGIDIQMGSVTVTGGNFVIDSSTPGSISLNSGAFTVTGTALGAPVNAVVFFSVDPITVAFADLGAATILGTADDSLAGDDTTAPGDEITLDWNGVSSQFTVDIDAFPFIFDITLTGSGLSIGAIPEPTSGLFLAGLVAGGAAIRRRRK